MQKTPAIVPLGESAVVVEFGNEISEELNLRAIALSRHLTARPFSGFIEAVPAYTSTTVFYDLFAVASAGGDTAFATVSRYILDILGEMELSVERSTATIEVETVFDERHGPDLQLVADTCGLSAKEVIDIFTSVTYRVFMVGFLPGFAYMGVVDKRLNMPRKQQPRQSVPRGSVGIAGPQTGVYPLNSPGGWQLIGHTDVEFFTPDGTRPSLLKAGDLVRFVSI